MGAPSDLHEARVASLRDLAFLSGHTVDFALARWHMPDVALRDPNRLRLFVGDAKATEISTSPETRRRLRSYVSATLPWRRAGFSVCFAVCVSAGRDDGWAALLADFGPSSMTAWSVTISSQERLVWVDLAPGLDEVGGRDYRSRYAQVIDGRRPLLRSGRAF